MSPRRWSRGDSSADDHGHEPDRDQEEVDQAHRRPQERLLEPHGRAVDAHHPQAQRRLARGAPAPQRLEPAEPDDDDAEAGEHGDQRAGGAVEVVAGATGTRPAAAGRRRAPSASTSSSEGDRPRGHAGPLEVEHHRLGRDDRAWAPPRRRSPRTGPHGTPADRHTRFRAAVDIDRFIARNQPTWHRLDELSARASPRAAAPRRRPRSTSWSSPTSGCRRTCPTPASPTTTRRSPPGSPAWSAGPTGSSTPAGRARCRRSATSSRGASPPPCGRAGGSWPSAPRCCWCPALRRGRVAGAPATRPSTPPAPEALREAYLEEDFESYYSSEPATQFATEVTVNNIQVAFTAFASGVLLCVPAAALLVFNGANVGFAGGLFADAGELRQVLRADPPPRPARADRRRHRRRRRPAAGLGGHRARRPDAGPGARRRGPPGRGDRPRPGAGVRGGRPHRGLRHRPRASRPACGSASACSPRLAFVGWIVVQGRAATARGAHRRHRRARPRLGRAGRRPRARLGVARRELPGVTPARAASGQSRPVALTSR